jgi:hypothetical protein
MGRGIAVVFAFAGHQVVVVDFKEREASAFEALAAEAKAEIRSTLEILSRIDLLPPELVSTIAERITIVPRQEAAGALPRCDVIFEGMPEILGLKQAALAEASRLAGEGPIIASTTSTILVDDLAGSIEHPGRFLNAHWLNPAYLVPLIELSPGAAHRAGGHGADEGAARRDRQGAGGLRRAAGLHRSQNPVAGDERGRPHGGGGRRLGGGYRQSRDLWLRISLRGAGAA